MRADHPCLDAECRQRFQTSHGAAMHYQRYHADLGRWRDGRQLVADGGVKLGVDHEALAIEAGQRVGLRRGEAAAIARNLCHEYARRAWEGRR